MDLVSEQAKGVALSCLAPGGSFSPRAGWLVAQRLAELYFVSRAVPHISRRAKAALFHMLALRRAGSLMAAASVGARTSPSARLALKLTEHGGRR